jgi:hypothetical protein
MSHFVPTVAQYYLKSFMPFIKFYITRSALRLTGFSTRILVGDHFAKISIFFQFNFRNGKTPITTGLRKLHSWISLKLKINGFR